MTWLAWRQQRGATLAIAVLAVVFVSAVLSFRVAGAHGEVWAWLLVVILLPELAGMLVGAPLFAREFERGTVRLVWTQGITRRRWFAVQVGWALGAVLVGEAIAQAAVSVVGPLPPGDMQPITFDLSGILPLAVALFAVALGLCCGAVLRRTVASMLVALVLVTGAQVAIQTLARPRYLAPLTAITTTTPTQQRLGPRGSWVLSESPLSLPTACTVNYRCSQRFAIAYQPASRFWQFQLFESGIYVALAALAVGVAWIAVRRRA